MPDLSWPDQVGRGKGGRMQLIIGPEHMGPFGPETWVEIRPDDNEERPVGFWIPGTLSDVNDRVLNLAAQEGIGLQLLRTEIEAE
jgi:hypothetical protein